MNDPIRPQFSDIDAFGLTHPGKVRSENQDHLFLGSLTRGVAVENTSLDQVEGDVVCRDRLAALDDGGTDNITMIVGRTLPED